MQNLIKFSKIKLTFFLLCIFSEFCFSQFVLRNLPDLRLIRVFEVTGTFNAHTFPITDNRLMARLGGNLPILNDFIGVPGTENYDIFYSNADGTFNLDGAHITIECDYRTPDLGGAFNIAHLELEFNNGFKISPTKITSFYASGNNYLPGTELLAIDCDKTTFTTLGNNSQTGTNRYLRITFDFNEIVKMTNITSCIGKGFEYVSENVTFNELNPKGTVYITTANGCNKIEIVELTFGAIPNKLIEYMGCTNDNYSLVLGGTVFNVSNPRGQATISGGQNCDTIVNVELKFSDVIRDTLDLKACKGSGFSLLVNNTDYNELNPEGIEVIPSPIGCDTLKLVRLNFENCNENCNIYIPNIFSTSSYYNSTFEIYLSPRCVVEDPQLWIYDRWGNLLYNSSILIWDGTFKSKWCGEGVYTYVFEYKQDGIIKYKAGSVTLAR